MPVDPVLSTTNVEPISTFPPAVTLNKLDPVEEAISRISLLPAVPCTAKEAIGEEEFMPTLPLVRTVNMEPAAAVLVTIEKGFSVPAPCTVNLAAGVLVPIPTLPFAKTFNIFDVCAESTLNIEDVAPVEEAYTESEPLDIIPPAPTRSDVPAIIFP